MSLPIVYCMMAQNRLLEVKHCIDLVEPYVDKIVIVDGGSTDDSIFYLRNREGVNMFIHPWKDNFSEQRNNYINRAREVIGSDDFWILLSDPDEWFDHEALGNLYNIQDRAEQVGCNIVTFQCLSATLKGDKRVWESLDNYWKGLFFKYIPGIKYVGNPHETLLIPGGQKPMQTSFIYQHVKQENIIWHRGLRNMYIGGGGPNLGDKNAKWLALKGIVEDVYGRDLSWREFETEMIRGNLDPRLKSWLYMAKDEKDYDGSSEMREAYKTYFRIYHPEEEPAEFIGEAIP